MQDLLADDLDLSTPPKNLSQSVRQKPTPKAHPKNITYDQILEQQGHSQHKYSNLIQEIQIKNSKIKSFEQQMKKLDRMDQQEIQIKNKKIKNLTKKLTQKQQENHTQMEKILKLQMQVQIPA